MTPSAKLPLLMLCLVGLTGCNHLSERHDYQADAQNQLETEQQHVFGRPEGDESTLHLGDLIASDQLDRLIKQALAGNPSLQRTALSLEASRWNIRSVQGEQLPQVDTSVSANREQDSDTRYSASANISWELDLWAQLADRESAALKTLASDSETYRASQASLAANVMKNWLLLIANQRAIDIERQRLALLETNEKLIIQRFRNGLGTLENLDQAETSTSQSRASLAEYQENLASNYRALKLLLGSNQDFNVPPATDYPEIIMPLTDLPNQSLALRPDLRAAYLAIEAADYNAAVAYKDMLPSLSLSASLSDSASTLRDALFVSPVWSLLGQLSAPIFQGNRLKAASEVAKIEVAQAYQDYRETLLTAVNEVENAIGQERVLATRRAHIADALDNAESNRQLYERRYRSGLVELRDLLDAQQSVFDLQAELDDLHYQQLTNRVDLGLALGLGVQQ
ncbi:TolC family protein [Marinomonas ostreistagni]|nr:TolC family protein [Marinomonas ostreistagni]